MKIVNSSNCSANHFSSPKILIMFSNIILDLHIFSIYNILRLSVLVKSSTSPQIILRIIINQRFKPVGEMNHKAGVLLIPFACEG